MRPSTRRLRRGLRDLAPALYPQRLPLSDLRMLFAGFSLPPQQQPVPSADLPGWQPVTVGDRWGAHDAYAWFHGAATLPNEWAKLLADTPSSSGGGPGRGPRYAVVLRLLLGIGEREMFGWPEGLLYVNGRLQQGINRHHPDVLLRPDDLVAGSLAFDVYAWSGMAPGDHRIEMAEIALLDRDAEALSHLLNQGAALVNALAENDPLTYALAAALEDAYDLVDMRQPHTPAYAASIMKALQRLRARLADLRAEYNSLERPVVTAVGHGHLDVAWLWRITHTREKTARTFGVATALMDAYPEYVFLHTTPQVFNWLRQDYPELYARVAERVREGRFEAAGAMWLESDTNLVSGESLVRQILYGQRFLREAFGEERANYDVLWLPDTFGYSAALPQLLIRSGIRAFMTTKMSWNDTNRIPMDTFRWRGLDGSETLAHFVTTPSSPSNPQVGYETYNGMLEVATVRGVWDRYHQKAINNETLLVFGYGDGGAGPTRQFLEQARALQELPSLPELRFGRADDFFHRLRRRVWARPDLPTWDGELYFEYHRGTYTSQAWLKRLHRQNEARLLTAETLAARLALTPLRGEGAEVGAALDDAWRALLLHEFHDILPGSSIHEVYEDAREAMTALATRLDEMIAQLLRQIAASELSEVARDALPEGTLVVYNPSPFVQDALLTLPLPATKKAAGWRLYSPAEGAQHGKENAALLTQSTTLADGSPALLALVPSLPARGYRLIESILQNGTAKTKKQNTPDPLAPLATERTLENAFFRLEFDDHGEITSCVEKRIAGGRELLLAGQTGNRLVMFDDRPRAFDAWDIDKTFERKAYPVSNEGETQIEVVEQGPLRATLLVRHRVLSSIIEQRISLHRDLPHIDFATRIDWHERHLLLKAAFPLDLRTTQARSEIQYGSIERATHRNTSWDQARFETCAHRWVDLSEAEYGVSLLNDGRYGHDIHDTTLRLSLLRSATYPDPEADQGEHVFTYSLYPHLGDWRAGGTIPAAYALNRPPIVISLDTVSLSSEMGSGVEAVGASFFTAEPTNVVIEAIKPAADGDGLIVRLYESHGARSQAHISAPYALSVVLECDLLERPLSVEQPDASPAYDLWQASPVASHDAPQLASDGRGWTCQMRPFEVRTFRVQAG